MVLYDGSCTNAARIRRFANASFHIASHSILWLCANAGLIRRFVMIGEKVKIMALIFTAINSHRSIWVNNK